MLDMNVGARIAELAEDDEILVSSIVRDLVAGSGIEFVERGAQILRGVPEEWRLYAVVPPKTEEPPAPV